MMSQSGAAVNSSPAAEGNKAKILIVEDDRDLNNLLKYTLETTHDFEVFSHFNGMDAVHLIQERRPDLIILDLMLPGMSGTDILREVRTLPTTANIPVILLTARSQEQDKIDGFEAGADDYITKPFSPKELLLRVQALLRRTATHVPKAAPAPKSQNALVIGCLRIFPDEFKVFVEGEAISLTVTEFQLLLHLAERVDRLQSRDVLLQKVWGYEGNVNTRTVDTHIKRLRQKLGQAGQLIETVHGFGYQLTSSPKGKFSSEE